MGYYVYHNLTIKTDTQTLDKIVKHISNTRIIDNIQEINDKNIYTFQNKKRLRLIDESTKWYDRQLDMRKLSIKFKDVVFELYGEGDCVGDIWIEYYKNGRLQRANARIVFEEFNEKMLM
ncbi:MAG: hypothetical protein ACRDD7_06825 [Peptostreptococcaceae bacterium]